MRRILTASLLALSAVATGAAPADAQSRSGQRQPQRIELLPQIVSINPLTLPFGAIIGEYEAVASPSLSFGASLAHYNLVGGDDDRYTSGEGKVRFYPGENAPAGFALGLTLGFGRSHEGGLAEGEDPSKGGVTTGVSMDHNWLVGPSRRFYIGSGVAVKRRFGSLKDDWIGLEVLPAARLQVGLVF